MKKRVLLLFLGMLLGGLIFSSIAFASTLNVQFIPLKYFVNGQAKTTLPGQQAFIYNGRTYVPLRFLAESLGCGVDWDRTTSSILITIDPGDVPAVPDPNEKKVHFTGVWRTEAGSFYNLKQNGTSVTGTFAHYADKPIADNKSSAANKSNDTGKPKYEFPVAGRVEDKTIELTWRYDNAEDYAGVKDIPLDVAQQVVGISETVSLTLNQETKILEGDYFPNYVEWDPNTHQVLAKADGNSQLANSKVPSVKLKLYFKNPI